MGSGNSRMRTESSSSVEHTESGGDTFTPCYAPYKEEPQKNVAGISTVLAHNSSKSTKNLTCTIGLIGLSGSGKSCLKSQVQQLLGSGFTVNELQARRRQICAFVVEAMLSDVLQCIATTSRCLLTPEEMCDSWERLDALQRLLEVEGKDCPKEVRRVLESLVFENTSLQELTQKHSTLRHFFADLSFPWIESPTFEDYLRTPGPSNSIRLMLTEPAPFTCTLVESPLSLQSQDSPSTQAAYYEGLFDHVFLCIDVSNYEPFEIPSTGHVISPLASCLAQLNAVITGRLKSIPHNTVKRSLRRTTSLTLDLPPESAEPSTLTVFFTKVDVLRRNLLTVPFHRAFPEYKGSQTFSSIVAFLKNMIRSSFGLTAVKIYFINTMDSELMKECLQETFLRLISSHVPTSERPRSLTPVEVDTSRPGTERQIRMQLRKLLHDTQTDP